MTQCTPNPLLRLIVALCSVCAVYQASTHEVCAQGSPKNLSQTIDSPTVKVTGTNGTIRLTMRDMEALPPYVLTVLPHKERDSVRYTGVLLCDVLTKAGETSFSKPMHGAALAKSVIVRASDGYAVAFGIAELDTATTPNRVYLVHKRNGAVLPKNEAPFRLVVPGDTKRQARWVRMIEQIEIVDYAAVPKK
jgi:DMSO/TMAO reductase YedYZ molybdopterin-dependent catalytic subunit